MFRAVGRQLGSLATVLVNRSGLEDIVASLVKVEGQLAAVLTGKLLTVDIPNVGQTMAVVGNFCGNLATSTNGVGGKLDGSFSRTFVDCDIDCVTDRTLTGVDSQHILSVIRGINGQIRTITELVAANFAPNIRSVLVDEAVEVGAERDILALADDSIVSDNLSVGTRGHHFDRSGSVAVHATSNIGNGKGIDTASVNHQRIFVGTIAPCIFIGVVAMRTVGLFRKHAGNDNCAVAIADYIVTRKSNFGYFVNNNTNRFRKNRSIAFCYHSLSRYIVDTKIIHVKN